MLSVGDGCFVQGVLSCVVIVGFRMCVQRSDSGGSDAARDGGSSAGGSEKKRKKRRTTGQPR
jgi:hypothetical protein